MKTISIKQPWAHLICTPREDNPQLGIKDIENRTWPTKFRGRVLVHASACKKTDHIVSPEVFDWSRRNYQTWAFGCMDSPKGAIIGSVEIVDCVINYPSIWAEKTSTRKDVINVITHNWVLANPVLFANPIPAKGSLSFWDFQMTEEAYFNLEKIGNPTK